jgi:hypothetical protein
MYAEDEVLYCDYGSQGSHVMYLRGTSPRCVERVSSHGLPVGNAHLR